MGEPLVCANSPLKQGVNRTARKFYMILGFDPTSIAPQVNYSKVVMRKSYVIQWKSLVNGRTGKGTRLFEGEEAQQLADELNREYPSIQHEAVEASAVDNGASGAPPGQPAQQPEIEEGPGSVEESEPVERPQAGSEAAQVTHAPDPVLSFK